MEEQKIKQDGICIGANIRRLRLEKRMGQTELVRLVQLEEIPMTRECLVKIERGVQHIQVTQLRAIRDALGVTYDALLEDSSAQKTAQCTPRRESGPGPGGHTGRPYEKAASGTVGADYISARAHCRVGCTIVERTRRRGGLYGRPCRTAVPDAPSPNAPLR